jgi:8-oxo-dGTP diphosphatase
MKKMVVGFVFDANRDLVLLIEKLNPIEQRGLLNGLGGKIEEYDVDEAAAMDREFEEECGLVIPYQDWEHVGLMKRDGDFQVDVFTATHPDLFNAKTVEAEKVVVHSTREIILGRQKTLNNVPMWVQRCDSYLKNNDKEQQSFLILDYTDKEFYAE